MAAVFSVFSRLGINCRSIVSAERLPEKKNIATFGGMQDGSYHGYAESEAYDSASVVPIHTRSELFSDSDSAYDSAFVTSVASVNQPLPSREDVKMLRFIFLVYIITSLLVLN